MTKDFMFDVRYLQMAFIWAGNSVAIRRKVGCLIVKDRSIISDGYNGTPSGFENECETAECSLNTACPKDADKNGECMNCQYRRLITKPYVLHAEANAITKLAKSHNSAEGATLYVTDEPCIECAKLIIQSGIRRVVYCREYHKHDGLALLNRAKIDVMRIPETFPTKLSNEN